MPKCQCCNQNCTLITSEYCEDCANMIISFSTDQDPRLIDDASDYVKNIKQGE